MRDPTITPSVLIALCTLALVGCVKAPDQYDPASAEAAAAAPTPPPIVNCSTAETDNARAGISAYIASNDQCVTNRSAIVTVVSSCTREAATGKLFVRATSTYSDTLLDNTNYSIETVGTLDPGGSPLAGSVNVNPNGQFLTACKVKGAFDGLTKHTVNSDDAN